jgi:hypothetical protein
MAFLIALTTARSNISHISKTARDCQWQFSHFHILPAELWCLNNMEECHSPPIISHVHGSAVTARTRALLRIRSKAATKPHMTERVDLTADRRLSGSPGQTGA